MFILLSLVAISLLGMALLPGSDGDAGAEPAHGDDATPVGYALTDLSSLMDAGADDPAPSESEPAKAEASLIDAILGTSERDVIFSGEGDDCVYGEDGDDYLDGEAGDDVLHGGAGDDELHGGAGDDALHGGDGDDLLFGHIGNDILFGGAGNDRLVGGDGDDILFGGDGNDSLLGGLGNDVLYGGAGSNVLHGGAGDDVLVGTDDGGVAAMDYLNGGAGNDTLIGGAFDNMHGGSGADIFVLDMAQAALGPAHVEDFDPTEDSLVLFYDAATPAPVLSTAPVAGGIILLADGLAVATLGGVTALDLDRVQLMAA
jgi:Ca2+-binding RTX toxin-like protein